MERQRLPHAEERRGGSRQLRARRHVPVQDGLGAAKENAPTGLTRLGMDDLANRLPAEPIGDVYEI
jgi:hypothetical protein